MGKKPMAHQDKRRKKGGEGEVRVVFSRDLAFFLPRGRGGFCCSLARRASVKDMIESFGVPHTEVGQVCFNGCDADFSFLPQTPGTLVASGVEPSLDLLKGDRLRPDPLECVRFVADVNVLKLGRYLLLLGYDTALAREESDAGIAELAASQGRVVLTRDTRLLFRKKISFARRIRSIYPAEQLKEVLGVFGLRPDPSLFFSRCSACNLPLEQVAKGVIYHRLEPKTQQYVHSFRICPGCGQIYWAGSHHSALFRRFRDLGILPSTT